MGLLRRNRPGPLPAQSLKFQLRRFQLVLHEMYAPPSSSATNHALGGTRVTRIGPPAPSPPWKVSRLAGPREPVRASEPK